jgi:hypothetical protein
MDEKERLWQHTLHEDTLFNERLNLFLVMQGLLLAVVGVMFQRPGQDTLPVIRIIVVAGLLLTLVSWRVQARQKLKLEILIDEVEVAFPEFKTQQLLTAPPKWFPVSNTTLLAHAIPLILLFVWVLLLVVSWT